MTQLVEGGRPIARFRLLGFPVTVDISFLVIVALLGWTPGVGVPELLIWIVVAAVSVLVHELGHAVVAKTTGAQPVITLAGLGGVTSYVPPRPLTRARSIAISVAGPAVGIVIGAGLVMVDAAVELSGLVDTAVWLATWATLGWSILNLLPILPLDGGQTLRELLPGSRAKRETRAATVSIVVSVLVALVAVRLGAVFGSLMALFLIVHNVMTIRQARETAGIDVNQRVAALLWRGRVDQARELASENEHEVSDVLRTVLAAVGPDGDDARRHVAAAAERSDDATASAVAVLVDRARGDWDAVRRTVAEAPVVASSVVVSAQNAAHLDGNHRASAEVGQAFLDRSGAVRTEDPDHAAHIAYNTACGWASVGDTDRGLAAFRRAADLGFADLTTVDSDEEIASLRPLPGYDEARQLIRERALAAAAETPPADAS